MFAACMGVDPSSLSFDGPIYEPRRCTLTSLKAREMARRPNWWHQMVASKNEATLAVDLYNRSVHDRQVEAFVVHMTLAWLKLIQALYMRETGPSYDLYIRDGRKRRQRTKDGDWLMKPLSLLISEVMSEQDPRRKNLEFFIGLRNKIEHRFDHEIAALVAGKSQALLLNYENFLVEKFGATEGLADKLRFPLFVSTITGDAVAAVKEVRSRVPRAVLDYVQDFDASLDPDTVADQSYDFRVYLLPKTGPKTQADVAMSFVRLEDLDADQLAAMDKMQTIIREKQVPVSGLGDLLPTTVVTTVQARIKKKFTTNDHTAAWRFWEVRPPEGTDHPERTKADFCRYNEPFKRWVYTDAWVDFLTRKMNDPETYEAVTGRQATALEVDQAEPSSKATLTDAGRAIDVDEDAGAN
ncbi:DUF3644 domain-containing protein [Actinomycetospora straminea]|nr:DUF3644 domain-containing protein [Actinomycetospora straminea]MDD7931921.1 DUF3644 domain-containing protein [Actinomycetospora straminea]